MSVLCRLTIFLSILSGHLFAVRATWCSNRWNDATKQGNNREEDLLIRRIPAAIEECGYVEFSPRVITTNHAFKDWLPSTHNPLEHGMELKMWDCRDEFFKAFRKPMMDGHNFFSENNIVVYAYSAPSGCGIEEPILDPIVNETNQTATITLDVHDSEGAEIMVSCALFYEVKKESIRIVYFDTTDVYSNGYTSKRVRHVVPTTTSDSPILWFVIEPSPNDEWGNLWGVKDMLQRIYFGFSVDSYQDLTTVVLDNLESFDEWLQRVLLTKKQSSEKFFRILRSLNTEKADVDFKHYNLVVHAFTVNEQANVRTGDAGVYERRREERDLRLELQRSVGFDEHVPRDSKDTRTSTMNQATRRNYVLCYQAHKSIDTIYIERDIGEEKYITTTIRNNPESLVDESVDTVAEL